MALPHAQLAAGSIEGLQEMLEAPVDFSLGGLCVLNLRPSRISVRWSHGPPGIGSPRLWRHSEGEDDILIGVLQSQLLVEA